MLKRILVVSLAIVVLALGAVLAVGLALPEEHVATASVEVGRSPAETWSVLTDFANHPGWRKDLERIERLPDRDGLAVWRETSGFGELTLQVEGLEPPRRFTTRIADPDLPFSGTWTFEIEPTARGCRVTITERGRVPNPVFRFVSRFVMGHTAALERYLGFLEARLG